MSREIRLQSSPLVVAQTPAACAPLARDLAEQVKFFAGDPAEGVLWSDVFAHLRGGLANLRRLWSELGGPSAR